MVSDHSLVHTIIIINTNSTVHGCTRTLWGDELHLRAGRNRSSTVTNAQTRLKKVQYDQDIREVNISMLHRSEGQSTLYEPGHNSAQLIYCNVHGLKAAFIPVRFCASLHTVWRHNQRRTPKKDMHRGKSTTPPTIHILSTRVSEAPQPFSRRY